MHGLPRKGKLLQLKLRVLRNRDLQAHFRELAPAARLVAGVVLEQLTNGTWKESINACEDEWDLNRNQMG